MEKKKKKKDNSRLGLAVVKNRGGGKKTLLTNIKNKSSGVGEQVLPKSCFEWSLAVGASLQRLFNFVRSALQALCKRRLCGHFCSFNTSIISSHNVPAVVIVALAFYSTAFSLDGSARKNAWFRINK